MNKNEIEVTYVLKAKVTVTDEMREGFKNGIISSNEFSDKEVAKGMLYASLNPRLSSWEEQNEYYEDYWDGVGNMQGLIKDVELEDDPFYD